VSGKKFRINPMLVEIQERYLQTREKDEEYWGKQLNSNQSDTWRNSRKVFTNNGKRRRVMRKQLRINPIQETYLQTIEKEEE
jgi:hypothetical protein